MKFVQILTSLGIVADSDIAAVNVNYQDAINTIQAALDNPEAEDLEANDLAILQRSLEIVSKRAAPSPLARAASALMKVRCLFRQFACILTSNVASDHHQSCACESSAEAHLVQRAARGSGYFAERQPVVTASC